MADEFRVSPEELRRVSAHLHDVSSAMKAVMSTLEGQLAPTYGKWGGDEMGDQFANGPSGYLAQLDWVKGSVDAKTALLDHYSDMLKQAADTFAQSDQPGLSYATPNPLVDQSGAFTQYGPAGALPAGAVGGAPLADMSTGGPGGVTEVGGTQGVPVNAGAGPITDTGAGNAAGSGGGGSDAGGFAPSASGGPATSGGDPGQSGSAGAGSGSSGATSGAQAAGGVPDDGLSGTADSGNAGNMPAGAGGQQDASDPSVTAPGSGPLNDAAMPPVSDPAAPGSPPPLPTPPSSPNKRRRRAAEDDPSSGPPGPETDGQSGSVEGSGAKPADPPRQRGSARPVVDGQASDTGVVRRAKDSASSREQSGSTPGRAGAVSGDSVRPETAAHGGRGGPGRPRRREATSEQAGTADDSSLAAGSPDGSEAGASVGGERGLDPAVSNAEQANRDLLLGDPDMVADNQVDDTASATTERQPSGREDLDVDRVR